VSIAIDWFINHVIMPLVTNLVAFWQSHWDQIELALRLVWTVIVDVIRVAWDVISGLFKFFLDLLSGNWQGAWDDISTMFKNIWDDMGKFLSDFFTKLLPTIGALALDLGKAIVDAILQGLGNLAGALASAIGGAISSAIAGAKSALGAAAASLASSIPIFGGLGQVVGNIPSFDQGGLMAHDGLAYVHAGEEIRTPAQQGQGSQMVHASFFLNGKKILDAISEGAVVDARLAGRQF
jgi:phage-related protein